MPFKTKKQKAHAAKNRVSVTESGFLTYQNTINTKAVEIDKKSDYRISARTIDESQHKGVRRELAKIFLLSSLIIGLQLALKASSLPVFN